MKINDALRNHQRIYGCSPAGDDGSYTVLICGMDEKGQQIKALITAHDQRTARHAAAAALLELGARVHMCIALMKAKPMPRLLTETDQRFTHNPPGCTTTAPLFFHHEVTTHGQTTQNQS